jgi:polar amino acid transport system substrate-binding protein
MRRQGSFDDQEERMKRSVFRSICTTAAVGLCALAAGACGSSSDDSSSESKTPAPASGSGSQAVASVAAKLPPAVKSKGTLIVAADATYAPNEFIGSDGKTVEGMDADLAKALAGVMGLKADVKNATFDGIIPGLAAHRYDLGMSSFTDTKEREKTVDFVTYFSAGTSFYVKAQGGPAVNTLADLCGKTVVVEKGTTQQTDAEAQSKKCSGGKVTVLTFPDQNGANLALSSGRGQVGMADSPVAAYLVKKSNGQFKLAGEPYGTAPYGIAMPKDLKFAPAVKAALDELIKNGTYKNILDKWGIAAGAIDAPVINGATS